MRFYRPVEGGAWTVDFWHNGRRFRRSTGTADRKAAQEWADRRKNEFWRDDRLGQRPVTSWNAAVLAWIEAHKHLRSLSDRQDQLRWASKELRGKPISSIDRAELDRLAKLKSKQGASDSTVNRHLAAISAVLRQAHKSGLLDSVPAIPRRHEPGTRIKWATQEQARKLVDALPEHWQPMAEFALATGLRRQNVTHLQWSEVDLRRRVAWVHADEAKGKRVLSIPLNDVALEILRGQKGQHASIVFPYQGRAVTRLNDKLWDAACKVAGLTDFRWHDLRHTWASWHVQNGTKLQALMELGGWRSFSMVLKYAHLSQSHVAADAGNSGLVRNRSSGRKPGRPKKAA